MEYIDAYAKRYRRNMMNRKDAFLIRPENIDEVIDIVNQFDFLFKSVGIERNAWKFYREIYDAHKEVHGSNIFRKGVEYDRAMTDRYDYIFCVMDEIYRRGYENNSSKQK